MGNFIKTKTQAATLVIWEEAESQQGRSSRGQHHTCVVGCVHIFMSINSCRRGETLVAGNLLKPEIIEINRFEIAPDLRCWCIHESYLLQETAFQFEKFC